MSRRPVDLASGGFTTVSEDDRRAVVELTVGATDATAPRGVNPVVHVELTIAEAEHLRDRLNSSLRILDLTAKIADLEADIADPNRWLATKVLPHVVALFDKDSAE
ncbi:hypothetical protein LQ938_09655 [Microbacterium sp. cx-55]|uniref:hypothetical protein n=1 Tax=Microbacterium sp. cx-55 TaxID=2875948 RepID=UPI001CBC316B|nr:hypothetical protein [Microbacterium sp. cx-55]MBZ4485974.1 hypothetical protein [Microbacterium sp. cx-55]UGB34152.1 hypothetical protein LQ938_09655 [Microbacterium sp. cx-55]